MADSKLFGSKRLQIIGLMSLSSGLPLGIVTQVLQIFLANYGVKLKTIGLLSAVGLAWSLKFVWSPLLDRYAFGRPDRRRSWVLIAQLGLTVSTLFLAYCATQYALPSLQGLDPSLFTDTGPKGALLKSGILPIAIAGFAIAVFSATQDIALDAYAVEFLRPDEQAGASALRSNYYLIGYRLLGNSIPIALSGVLPWPVVLVGLAALFLVMMVFTLLGDVPEVAVTAPRTLMEAVRDPLLSFFSRNGAVKVAIFLILYKFGLNFALTLLNPFYVQLCFSNVEIGLAVKWVGIGSLALGTFVGAYAIPRLGLGRALWLFGIAQAVAISGYALAATTHVGAFDASTCPTNPVSMLTRAVTYGSIGIDYLSMGMADTALGALLLRITERRYAATQFALLSSLFGFGRTLSGIPSGYVADALGFAGFFLAAIALSIPGLIALHTVAPIGEREVKNAPIAV